MSRRTRFILAVALGRLVAGYYQLNAPPSTGHMFSQSSQPPKTPNFRKLFPKSSKNYGRYIQQNVKSQTKIRKVSFLTHQPKSFFIPSKLRCLQLAGIGVGVAAMPEWAEGGGLHETDWVCVFFLETFLLFFDVLADGMSTVHSKSY